MIRRTRQWSQSEVERVSYRLCLHCFGLNLHFVIEMSTIHVGQVWGSSVITIRFLTVSGAGLGLLVKIFSTLVSSPSEPPEFPRVHYALWRPDLCRYTYFKCYTRDLKLMDTRRLPSNQQKLSGFSDISNLKCSDIFWCPSCNDLIFDIWHHRDR